MYLFQWLSTLNSLMLSGRCSLLWLFAQRDCGAESEVLRVKGRETRGDPWVNWGAEVHCGEKLGGAVQRWFWPAAMHMLQQP